MFINNFYFFTYCKYYQRRYGIGYCSFRVSNQIININVYPGEGVFFFKWDAIYDSSNKSYIAKIVFNSNEDSPKHLKYINFTICFKLTPCEDKN